MKEINERNKDEHFLVTDGSQLYRLAPRHKIPKGLTVIKTHNQRSVYTSQGKLKSPYNGVVEIEPRNNIKLLTRTVRHLLESGIYHNNQ